MNISLKPPFPHLILITALLLVNNELLAQGRLLRGAEKTEYVQTGTSADFYVSPAGNDAWSGRLSEPNKSGTDGPFATIGQAKIAVSKLKSEVYLPKKKAVDKRFRGTPHPYGVGRDILVLIREGVYALDHKLEFSASDGGERVETDLPTGAFEYHELKDYYVTYAAYPGESPVISGGERITGWKKGKGGIWTANTNAMEINELYVDGEQLTIARTPNTGYFYTDGQPTDSSSFKFKGDDLKAWKELENSKIHLKVRWGAIQSGITRIDTKNHTAWLKTPVADMLIIQPKYFVENMEALLDTTGEYYFNKKAHTISFIPESGIANPNSASVIFPNLENLVVASGSREKPIRNLRFFNLRFSDTRTGAGAAISFQYAENCEVLKNRIDNVCLAGIWFGVGSYHNLISKNTISNVKGSGIIVSGNQKPEQWSDLVRDNTITYNKITNMNIGGTGITAFNSLRTTVSHNYISHTSTYGITLGYWPNIEQTSDGNYLAEYNHVSFTNMNWDDQGGIAVYGLSPGSIVRNNVIHDVHPAATNENVALFFQNMSSGWTVTDNTYYNLKQGEMKLCACYLVDNLYENNHLIETPAIRQEDIIDGKPDLDYSDLQVKPVGQNVTGSDFSITAMVSNNGSTGMEDVFLYVDGKVAVTRKLPFISNNQRKIEFLYKFFDPGKHTVGIGKTAVREVEVSGKPLFIVYRDFKTPLSEVPLGDSIVVSIMAQNVRSEKITQNIELVMDGKPVAFREVRFAENESRQIRFSIPADAGLHEVSAGNQPPLKIHVYPINKVDVAGSPFLTYCSPTANPCQFEYDIRKNHFEINAAGSDFLHGEDSYGAIYLKGVVEGNFVATVKVTEFSEGISDWFRAGIFLRNDMAKGSASKSSTLGSMLLFSTTKRCGAQWDEFGDGSMHNTKSTNYGVDHPLPVWLKLVRHGNRFTGYYSFDGKTWIISRESGEIPGLAQKMDIGLAGGANDQKVSKVIFEDFQLQLERR